MCEFAIISFLRLKRPSHSLWEPVIFYPYSDSVLKIFFKVEVGYIVYDTPTESVKQVPFMVLTALKLAYELNLVNYSSLKSQSFLFPSPYWQKPVLFDLHRR